MMNGRRILLRGQGPPDDLVDEYLVRVRENLELLEKLLEDLRSGEPGAEERIRALGHNYRGTGASYGFPEVTEAGHAVEEAPEAELEEAARALAGVLEAAANAERRTAKVLLVDDDEMIHQLLESAFRHGGVTVHGERTVAGAWGALTEQSFDALVLDLFLEDGDGRQLLTEIREHPSTSRIPVIVVSGRGTHAVQAECARLGADAYLPKPLDPEVLGATIRRELERAQNLEADSRLDPVTRLPNRAALAERFDEFFNRAVSKGTPLALARIEIDQYSELQEEHGHLAADRLLADFGSVLEAPVRKVGVLGRWEGPELLALMPELEVEEATGLLEELLAEVRGREFERPPEADGAEIDPFHVTFSAGVVDATDFDRFSLALLEAERGLMTARATGGGAVAARTPETVVQDVPRILVVEDDDTAAELYRHRLERDGLEVHRLATGIEAEELIKSGDGRDYDLMLLDIKLPGRDGFEILQMARSRSEWRNLPIVVITAMGREAHVVRAFELGADDYILKPFAAAELLARVHRLLR